MDTDKLSIKELGDIANANYRANEALELSKTLIGRTDCINDVKTDIAVIKNDLKQILTFIEEAPKNFASKLSEKIVYGLVGIIIVAVGSAVVAGVIKAAEYFIN